MAMHRSNAKKFFILSPFSPAHFVIKHVTARLPLPHCFPDFNTNRISPSLPQHDDGNHLTLLTFFFVCEKKRKQGRSKKKEMARPIVPSRTIHDLLLPPKPVPASHLLLLARTALGRTKQKYASLKMAAAQSHARFSKARDVFEDGKRVDYWGTSNRTCDWRSDSGFESGVGGVEEEKEERGGKRKEEKETRKKLTAEERAKSTADFREREKEWRGVRERVRYCEWDLLTLEADVSLTLSGTFSV